MIFFNIYDKGILIKVLLVGFVLFSWGFPIVLGVLIAQTITNVRDV